MASNKDNNNNGLLFALLAAVNKKLAALVKALSNSSNIFDNAEARLDKRKEGIDAYEEKLANSGKLTYPRLAELNKRRNSIDKRKETLAEVRKKFENSKLGLFLQDSGSVAGLKNAAGVLGAIFAVWIASAKAGIKAFKESEAATKELTSSFKQLNGTVSNSLSDANRAQNEKKNVEASKDLTKQFMAAERYVGATNNVFRKLGLTLQDVVNTLRKKLLGWLNDGEDFTKMVVKAIVESNTSAFLNTGVADTSTAGLYSAHAVDYALNYARNISSNQGLEFEALLQTEDYQQALQRANSWYTSGMDSNIFQGGLAELLGDAYVPNLTMSKEVMAGYIDQLIAKLADMSLEEQQATLAAWENAGTLLNAVGKNLYSFDEVIGQDAIEVNSSRIEGILQGLEADYSGKDDLLADIQADVRQIAENGLYENSGLTGDHVGGGSNAGTTGGTGSGGASGKARPDLYEIAGANAATGWMNEDGSFTELLTDALGNYIYQMTTDALGNQSVSIYKSAAEWEKELNERGSVFAASSISAGSKAYSYNGFGGGNMYDNAVSAAETARELSDLSAVGGSRGDTGYLSYAGAQQLMDGLGVSAGQLGAGFNTPQASGSTTVNNYFNGLTFMNDQQQLEDLSRTIVSTADSIKQRDGGL